MDPKKFDDIKQIDIYGSDIFIYYSKEDREHIRYPFAKELIAYLQQKLDCGKYRILLSDRPCTFLPTGMNRIIGEKK